jgi:Protein of unknown function (DUF3048) N-terminal domain/Protein of unknown function (DUF3048) C-terminal domain
MTKRRRTLLKVGLPAAGAAVLACAISLVLALTSSATPVTEHAQPMLYPRPRSYPLPAPPHVATRLYSPFTGEPVRALKPVLAVKIDNIVDARPQTGLQSADLVYVIPVEGGLTRFMAVYSSRVPSVVGPTRSARESDLDILRQFGRPGFAWSGATPHLVPFIERARLADLYALQVGGYYRVSYRVAPHNLYANPRVLLKEARHASKARDIGFRFGPSPAGGRAMRSYTVSYPAATYTFRWSAKAKRWLVWMDGAPGMAAEGGQLGGSTVIIQYTRIALSRFEEYGGLPPMAESIGSGRAVILRNGRAYTVHWSRPNWNGGTTFTLPGGKRMLFAAGQTWVVLAPQNHASFVNAAAT